MGESFGINKRMFVSDNLDSDSELEFSMVIFASDGDEVNSWLNKEDAVKLIEHIKKVFNI